MQSQVNFQGCKYNKKVVVDFCKVGILLLSVAVLTFQTQNCMSKTNKEYLAAILQSARNLQMEYDAIGSPNTQRIRNPFPMWAIVSATLPKFKSRVHNPEGLTINEVMQSLKEQGYIANKSSVGVALNSLVRTHNASKSRHNRPSKNPNRKGSVSFCRYFIQQG